MASQEIRERLERLPHLLIRLGALRLPADLRAERLEEWQAELYEILRGAEALPLTRLVIATRFALGLLRTSPAIGRELNGASAQPLDTLQAVPEASATPVTDDSLIESPYGQRFAYGATIVPRMLFFVEQRTVDPLGTVGGSTLVSSERSSTEKAPWKDLPAVDGVVESRFLRPVLLGGSVLPYRVLPPRTAVLPVEGTTLIGAGHPNLDLYPGLAAWWRRVDELWKANRTSDRPTLIEQLDIRQGITAQLPSAPLRVVYASSGMVVAAALLDNPSAILGHGLYWTAVTSRAEAMYLCAILNTPALSYLVQPLMTYGKGQRHNHNALWKLPIPLYHPAIAEHRRLAELGTAETERIKGLNLHEMGNFVTLRRAVREALDTSPHAEELDQRVTAMLGV